MQPNHIVNICPGDSVTITSSAATGNTFNTGATANSITVTTGGIYFSTIGAGTGCAVNSDTITVVLSPAAVTPIITGPASVCPGDSVTLTSSPNGSNIHWSNGMNGGTIRVVAGTYTATLTNIAGCTATSQSFVVAQASLPVVPALSLSGGVLSIPNTAGNTYQFFLNGAPVTGATSNSFSPTQNGVYTLTVTNAAGCKATSAPFTVTGLGIADAGAQGLALTATPNPFSQSSVISFTLPSAATVALDVLDAAGRQVSSLQAASLMGAGTHTLNFAGMQAGVYIIRLNVDGRTATMRLMKADQ